MIDLRTLVLTLSVTDLMLAAALWLGASQRLRDGMPQWGGSLVVRSLGLAVLASQGPLQAAAVAVGAALLAMSMTLQAAALLAFDRKALGAWIHTAVLAGVAVPFQLLESDRGMSMLFGGLVFGIVLLVVAAIAAQIQVPALSRARGFLITCFAAAGLACLLRGVGAAMVADPLRGFLEPSGFVAATFLAAFAALIASTFGFVMLHKERADAEARRLATIDPLTGAYNRSTFHEIAERELSRARRAGQPLSIVMLDIDHFRLINEKHGHRTGDEVLRQFAHRVRSALRIRRTCSWCYGFGPELARLLDRHPQIRLDLVMGGLRPFNKEPMSDAFRAMLLEHWRHVAEASGLPLSRAAIDRDDFIYDTEPACRAVVTARYLEPGKALAYMKAVQAGFYRDGRDATHSAVLADLAQDTGFERERFAEALDSPLLRAETRADFARAQAIGVGGFPTVAMERRAQLYLLTSGFVRGEVLEQRLQEIDQRISAPQGGVA